MSCTGPAPEQQESRSSSGESRDTSPEMALQRSMESLEMVNSGSSEECLLEGSPIESAEHLEDGSEKAVSLEGREEEESKAAMEPDAQDGPKKEQAKGKKRRISSRRERKISLTSSDKVVCKIAGVQVTN